MNHLISTHISEQINNFFMNAVLLCLFTRRPAAFLTIQPSTIYGTRRAELFQCFQTF